MTQKPSTYRTFYWIASFIIAAVLLAGYRKMLHPADFAVAVYRFRLLPGFLVNLTAIYLPWLELACAGCLLFVPRYRVAALRIVLVLLMVFTLAVGINLWRGSAFGCGCFGRGTFDQPLSGLHLARNMVLIALAGLALLARKKAEKTR